MKFTKRIFTAALLSVVAAFAVLFAACELSGHRDTRAAAPSPEGWTWDVESSYDSLTVINSVEDYVMEYSLDGINWQDDATITGLQPGTDYRVYVRYKESERLLASETVYATFTTLKYSQNAPEVEIKQEYGKVTFEENAALEFSYDGGTTYVSANTFTYTEEGTQTVKVRYKETADKYCGEDKVFNIKISKFYGGFGTEEEPYLINSVDELRLLSLTNSNFRSNSFKLNKNLDFTGEEPVDALACLSFDGNGKTLNAPKVNPNVRGVGVFVNVRTVKNLTVSNAEMYWSSADFSNYSDNGIGILAQQAGEVINCHVSGTIEVADYKTAYIGGLVGNVKQTMAYTGYKTDIPSVISCSADVVIKASASGPDGGNPVLYAGGLIGYITGAAGSVVSGCYAKADMEADGMYLTYTGGLIGCANTCDIVDCYTEGDLVSGEVLHVDMTKTVYLGGICGSEADGNISSCYSSVNLTADRNDDYGTRTAIGLGGIVGRFILLKAEAAEIENCMFAGNLYVSTGQVQYRMDTVSTSDVKDKISNCYHIDGYAGDIQVEKSVSVSEETAYTAAWQQNTLGLSADKWNFKDGELPVLR